MSNLIPILLYHRIDNEKLVTSTPPQVFQRHLELMKEQGWRALSAEEFTHIVQGRRPAPLRSFLITFDDGYESVYKAALPVLRRLNYPAICFVVTRFMRAPRNGEGPPADVEPDKFMSWDQVRALQESGLFDCQSHTHAHDDFRGKPFNVIKNDLDHSLALLMQELRLPRRHFRHLAWPWGMSMPEWRTAARDLGLRYQYGVSRLSFRSTVAHDAIPRTCFDGVPINRLQWQLRLQTGAVAPLWERAYFFGKRLRDFSRLLNRVA